MSRLHRTARRAACCTSEWDILLAGASDDDVVRMHAATPDDACRRAADLYGRDVIAWRVPPVAFVAGVDPRSIIG